MTTRQTSQAKLDRSGYTDANGKAGRIVESGRLLPPRWARIEREKLHCKYDFGAHVEPPPDLLDRFIELWKPEVDDTGILEFARAYGTLQRPLFLSQKRLRTDFEDREPLSRWRALSKHAFELLQIASALRAGDKLTFEQWSELMPEDRILSGVGPTLALGTREQWQKVTKSFRHADLTESTEQEQLQSHAEGYLFAEITAWNTKLGPVSFGIEEDDDSETGWKTVLDFGGSMICYVGFQLILVVANGDVYTCSACSRPYMRPRGRLAPRGLRKSPAAGQRNYCQSENCIRVRNRLATARRRERLAQAKEK